MGPAAWRRLLLLGRAVGPDAAGGPVPAADAAHASSAAALQVDLARGGRASARIRRAPPRAHENLRDGAGGGSHRHSLALCLDALRAKARRAMAMRQLRAALDSRRWTRAS